MEKEVGKKKKDVLADVSEPNAETKPIAKTYEERLKEAERQLEMQQIDIVNDPPARDSHDAQPKGAKNSLTDYQQKFKTAQAELVQETMAKNKLQNQLWRAKKECKAKDEEIDLWKRRYFDLKEYLNRQKHHRHGTVQ